jgi:hypothetical protein
MWFPRSDVKVMTSDIATTSLGKVILPLLSMVRQKEPTQKCNNHRKD